MLIERTTVPRAAACCAAEGAEPPRAPPRPRALFGARVARSGVDRVEVERTFTVLFEVALDVAFELRFFAATITARGEATAEHGFATFDRALTATRAARVTSVDLEACERAINSARDAVQRLAVNALRDEISAALERAQNTLLDAESFALDSVDQAPNDRRSAVARSAESMLDQLRSASAPSLSIEPRAVLCTTLNKRTAKWRLSSEVGSAVIASFARSDGSRSIAPCPACGAQSAAWTLCARCVAPRCPACARRCARCRRVLCIDCAPSLRCPSCGLSAIEVIDEP